MKRYVVEKVKKREGAKVSINLQVPEKLKDDFYGICQNEGVSMTSVIVALMEIFVDDESCGNRLTPAPESSV